MSFCYRFLLWIDQGGNMFLGGSPDETISARAWRCRESSRAWGCARRMIDALFSFEPDHCQAAFENEKKRAHLPEEYWEP